MPLSQGPRVAVRTASELLSITSVSMSGSLSPSAPCTTEADKLSLVWSPALLLWPVAGKGAATAGTDRLAEPPAAAAEAGPGLLWVREATPGFWAGSSRRRLKPAGGCSVTVSWKSRITYARIWLCNAGLANGDQNVRQPWLG